MTPTIIAELDGTRQDGRFRHYACYSRILASQEYSPLSLDEY